MIHIVRDPDPDAQVLELCCFCYEPTPFWFEPNDVACCRRCAAKHKTSDVPAKDTWWDACERLAKSHR